MKILEIVKRLYPFDYLLAGEGNYRSIKEFKKFLKFKVHNFKYK